MGKSNRNEKLYHSRIFWSGLKNCLGHNQRRFTNVQGKYRKITSKGYYFILIITKKAIASKANPKNSKYCGQKIIKIDFRS